MDMMEAIRARKSVRRYQPTPIPEQKLQAVLNAARLAPSAQNLQPWKFIVVRDESLKRKLVNGCHNQKFIAEAPVVIVACALEDEATAMVGGYMNSYPMDIAVALTHLILAATSEGLGTCLIGEFSEERVKAVLNIPREIRVVALTPLGFPAESPQQTGRKNLSEIVCYDQYK